MITFQFESLLIEYVPTCCESHLQTAQRRGANTLISLYLKLSQNKQQLELIDVATAVQMDDIYQALNKKRK